jgi:hypothetical protein
MTLKEKFLPFVDWMDLQDDCTDRNWALRNANKCVDVADEFSIGFAEWFTNEKSEYSIMYGNQEKRFATFTKDYTTKELLEIYKKEQGL